MKLCITEIVSFITRVYLNCNTNLQRYVVFWSVLSFFLSFTVCKFVSHYRIMFALYTVILLRIYFHGEKCKLYIVLQQ